MAIEKKEKNGLSEHGSKDKLVSYILLGIWLILLVCSAILFGIVGQTMIDVYNNVTKWTDSTLGMFVSAIVLGCLGLILYISWAVILFKKPTENVIKIINSKTSEKEKEKEKGKTETNAVTPAVTAAPTTNPVPAKPVSSAPVGYPRPALPPRPVAAPAGYPRPAVAPGYPRPVATPAGYPRPAVAPGYPRPVAAPAGYSRPVAPGYPRPVATPVGYQQPGLPPRQPAYPQR